MRTLASGRIDTAVRLSQDMLRIAVNGGRSMSAYRPKVKVLHGTIFSHQIRIGLG